MTRPPAPLILPPDIEQLVSAFLRAQPEITEICAGRVYTDPPAAKRAYPLVLVHRAGGAPKLAVPIWLDQAIVSAACWGSSHAEAGRLAATCCAALAQRLPGAWPGHGAVVTRVQVTDLAYAPDDTAFDQAGTARPRYLVTAVITSHPAGTSPARQ
jgi:hypothetical protein